MKIALIGSAGSVHLAPYEDQSFQKFRQGLPSWPPPEFGNEQWQIWGCSPGAAGAVRRASRWFELHRWEPGQPWLPQAYCEFLRTFEGPVYVGGPPDGKGGLLEGIPREHIPNQVLYPIARVEDAFSSYFLTNSLALMMALAILEIEDRREQRRAARETARFTAGQTDQGGLGVDFHVDPMLLLESDDDDVIGLWGVDMAAGEEWEWQRPGCQHFILAALQRGIGVLVPPESCLLRPTPVYGLSEWQHSYIKLTQRSREMNSRMQAAQRQQAELQNTIASLAGAIDDLNYNVKTWSSPYGLPAGQVLRLKKDAQFRRPSAEVGELHGSL